MSENNNNQNGQPTKEGESSDKTEPKLREISDEELKQILEDHEEWLNSDGEEGKPAVLKRTNLQNHDFLSDNLQQVVLYGANLQNALLSRVNLRMANLGQVNLREAYLHGAKGSRFDRCRPYCF